MTGPEISALLGLDGAPPRAVADALALIPVPQDAAETASVMLMATLAAVERFGRLAAAPDMRRRYR